MREFLEEVEDYHGRYREVFDGLVERSRQAIREVFCDADVRTK